MWLSYHGTTTLHSNLDISSPNSYTSMSWCVQGTGAPVYLQKTMAHIVLPCVPFYIILYIISNSKTFLILIFFSIFLVYKKYQVLEFSNLAMKHDNYGSSMLSNLLEVSYFVMILIFMHDKVRIFLNLLDVSSMYCIFSTLPLNLYMSWLTRLFCVAPRIFCIMSL